MNIKGILQFYLQYYEKNRSVGHTAMVRNGAVDNPNGIVLFASGREASAALDWTENGYHYANTGNLLGRRSPIAWDNNALYQLFREALVELVTLEDQIITLKCDLAMAKLDNVALKQRIPAKSRKPKKAKKRA